MASSGLRRIFNVFSCNPGPEQAPVVDAAAIYVYNALQDENCRVGLFHDGNKRFFDFLARDNQVRCKCGRYESSATHHDYLLPNSKFVTTPLAVHYLVFHREAVANFCHDDLREIMRLSAEVKNTSSDLNDVLGLALGYGTIALKPAQLRRQIENTKHPGIQCDMCQAKPIVGPRYKCMDCFDFDMCQQCAYKLQHPRDHPLRVYLQASVPKPLSPRAPNSPSRMRPLCRVMR